MTTFRFLRSSALPEETYADLSALADRVQDLRDGRPIVLSQCFITTSDKGDTGRESVVVRLAETGETLGYAIIGEPPLKRSLQFDMLGGKLAQLCPDIAA